MIFATYNGFFGTTPSSVENHLYNEAGIEECRVGDGVRRRYSLVVNSQAQCTSQLLLEMRLTGVILKLQYVYRTHYLRMYN